FKPVYSSSSPSELADRLRIAWPHARSWSASARRPFASCSSDEVCQTLSIVKSPSYALRSYIVGCAGANFHCEVTICILLIEPPKIICPADQIAATPKPGDVSVIVNSPAPSVTDNCPGATFVCSPPSGAAFPIGVTTVIRESFHGTSC